MTRIFPFVRRNNLDSSIDSICSTCYQTIMSTDKVSDLTFAEQDHVCNPSGEFNFPNGDWPQHAA
jgi:hypothetical protein